jgi:arylsulfatase A-like enzyme
VTTDGYKSLTQPHAGERRGARLVAGVLWGLTMAAALGATEGLSVALADTYPVTMSHGLVLTAAGAAGTVAVVAAPLIIAGALLGRWASGWSREMGAIVGLYLAGMAGFTVDWFTDPPPHAVADPWHGHPLVFLAVSVVFGVVAIALGRALRGRWPAGGLVLAGLLFGIHWIAHPAMRTLPDLVHTGADAPDVVMVTIDTIRADHVSALAETDVRTPSMDRLAAEGARFVDAFAQIPVTGPSHLTMMTGVGPWRHGVLLNGVSVPDDLQTLAERFHARGYRTGAFVSAFVLQGQTGFDRGFEVYDDDFGPLPGWQDTVAGRAWSALRRRFDPHLVLERQAGETVVRAMRWLDRDDPRPVFLWVHLFDPHGPYAPPGAWSTAYATGDDPRDPANHSMDVVSGVAAYMRPSLAGIRDLRWVLGQYSGEVSYVDEQLGHLMQQIDAQGRADRTVLVVAGDHGESLGEHGVWFNHGGDLQDQELRVPLFIRYPPAIAAGRRVTGPVELTDLAPTIAELTGLDTDGMDGVSLMPAIAQERTVRRFARGLCYDRPANLAARASGEITGPTYTVASLRGEDTRFELRTAPGTEPRMWRGQGREEQPVADPLADEDWPADALTELMGATIGDGSGRDAATLEKLRALGYVQ